MTTILSIDPGGAKTGETGIALGRIGDHTAYNLIKTWAVPDNIDGLRGWFHRNAEYYEVSGKTLIELDNHYAEVDVVVCEKWVDRNIPGADRSPMLVEGAVRFLWPEVVLQPASGKNTAVSNDVLKRLGVYTAGGHHADIREATRHGVWYCKKRLHRPTLEVGWPKP